MTIPCFRTIYWNQRLKFGNGAPCFASLSIFRLIGTPAHQLSIVSLKHFTFVTYLERCNRKYLIKYKKYFPEYKLILLGYLAKCNHLTSNYADWRENSALSRRNLQKIIRISNVARLKNKTELIWKFWVLETLFNSKCSLALTSLVWH